MFDCMKLLKHVNWYLPTYLSKTPTVITLFIVSAGKTSSNLQDIFAQLSSVFFFFFANLYLSFMKVVISISLWCLPIGQKLWDPCIFLKSKQWERVIEDGMRLPATMIILEAMCLLLLFVGLVYYYNVFCPIFEIPENLHMTSSLFLIQVSELELSRLVWSCNLRCWQLLCVTLLMCNTCFDFFKEPTFLLDCFSGPSTTCQEDSCSN